MAVDLKSSTPLISVVIPVFNRSWQLKRALDSLRHQTFHGFEVIVCDDGSTEDISRVVNSFKEFLNICFLQIPNSGGPAKPRNEGLKIAKGQWIAFLDSDDWWDVNRLELVAKHLHPAVDFIYHRLRVEKELSIAKSREKRAHIGKAISGESFKQMMLLGNPVPTSAAVVRKDLLMAHQGMSEDVELIAVEDFDCWLRLASAGARFYFLDECLGSYWVGGDAISAVSPRQIDAQKLLYQRHASRLHSIFSAQALARQNYVLGSLYFRLGMPQLALSYFRMARPLCTWAMATKRIFFLFFALVKVGLNQLKCIFSGKA